MKPIGYYLFKVFDESDKRRFLSKKNLARWLPKYDFDKLDALEDWWVVTNKRQYADLPPWPEALQSALTLMHEEEQP